MKYIGYTIDQIMMKIKNYQELCDIFLDLASNEEIRLKLKDILYKGKYKDYDICSKIVNIDNPTIEGKRRIAMAYLLIRNPETFDILVQYQINLFHGTNSNVLPTIKYGLNSVDELEKRGIKINTGEEWSRIGGKRDFVSLTDVLDIAEEHSTLKSDKNNLLSFEVIIGTTVTDVLQAGKCIISSDVPEVGVRSRLPLESIKIICVPTDKVDIAKKIIDTEEIKILAIDGINEKFYYIDDFNTIHILSESLNKLRRDLYGNKEVYYSEKITR